MESTKRFRKTDVVLTLIIVAPMALFCGYSAGPLVDTVIAGAPAPSQWRAFNDVQWRANPPSRPGMVCYLQFWRRLYGLDRKRIIALLGQPDGPYAAIARLAAGQKNALRDLSDDYILNGSLGACSHMTVLYGADGKVDKVFVLEQSPF